MGQPKKLQDQAFFDVKHNGRTVVLVTEDRIYERDGYSLNIHKKP